MTSPILVDEGKRVPRRDLLAPAPGAAWRWVGWISVALLLVGATDFLLVWYPLAFGSVDWEFASVATSFSGLPLVTIGLVGILGTALALGKRWLIVTSVALNLMAGVVVVGLLLLFLTVVPMALRVAEPPIGTGIKKAIVKTLVIGVVFGFGYLAAGIGAALHLRKPKGGKDA
jgi:hypothetical protein